MGKLALNSNARLFTHLSPGMSTIAENPDGARRVAMKEQQEAEFLSDCESTFSL
jgi:hypothetical protein